LTGENREGEAIPECREALRIYPSHKPALIVLAIALTKDRQFNDAVPVLREAIASSPEMSLLHKHLGLALFNTGDIEGAVSEDVLYLPVGAERRRESCNVPSAPQPCGASMRTTTTTSKTFSRVRR
jgi:tetratricopeptide (TPR) repeat protein